MAIPAFVATATNFALGVTTLPCAFSPNPTTGNGLICLIGTADPTSTITNISDTLGNAWISVGVSAGNGLFTACYYVKQCKTSSGTNTVSVTVTGNGNLLELNLFEVAPGSGAGSILFDVSVVGTDPTNPGMGPTPTLSVAAEFAVGYGVVGGNVVGITTAGWTAVDLSASTDDLLGYQVTTATTPLSLAWTFGGSGAFTGLIATFKSSTAGGVAQQATDRVAPHATLGAIAKVTKFTTDRVAAHATITPTANAIHKANVTI